MCVDSCICQSTGAVGIHGIGASIRRTRAACMPVKNHGVGYGKVSRPIECEYSHSGIAEGVLPGYGMAGSVLSAVDKGIAACQRGVAALGVNRQGQQGHNSSQSKKHANDSFHRMFSFCV